MSLRRTFQTELTLYQTALRVVAQLTTSIEPIPHLGPLDNKERPGKERFKCWDAGGYDADLFETGKEVKDVCQWLPEGK